ncbi:MAG: hypothetical protein ACHQQQ_07255 [Bacteroidota bacterium]
MAGRGEISMITPEKFYDKTDLPDRARKIRMWQNIRQEIHKPKFLSLYVADTRSFIWGMAAAVLIYFASVGVYTTVRQSIQNSQPQVVRLDAAYQSAIKEFENVVPIAGAGGSANPGEVNYITLRKDQLSKIDGAITGLKSESMGADLSTLKQQKLRELYTMKLKVLQEMIENGEVEL